MKESRLPNWVLWLSCKLNTLKFQLSQLSVIIRYAVTGKCGLECGMATFRELDGTPFRQFVPEESCPIHDKSEVKYVGWIRGKRGDADRLTELGVRGSMIYRENMGVFEHCEVPNVETLDRLERTFPTFWRGSFSIVSDDTPR